MFIGSQKKPRSFDITAMFEEARKTAIERTHGKIRNRIVCLNVTCSY